MATCIPNSLSILGVPVTDVDSSDDILRLIKDRIRSHEPTFCVAINPEKVHRAERDARLSQALHASHVRICDGVGVSLASWLLYGKRLPRCTGVDLFLKLLRLSAETGWKVFLLGASAEVNDAACRALAKTLPGLQIVGSQHGYFEHTADVIENINESGADLLFVAMGSPRQEFWISEQMPNLRVSFCMGVGGSFDVVSGTVKRAPALFRTTGTEWLYRLLTQPSRIRRQMALPLFAWDTVRAMAHNRIGLRRINRRRPRMSEPL